MVAVEVYLQTATIVVFRIVADNQDLANNVTKRSFGKKFCTPCFFKSGQWAEGKPVGRRKPVVRRGSATLQNVTTYPLPQKAYETILNYLYASMVSLLTIEIS